MKEKYVIRDFHPLVLFYLLGMSLSGAGFALGLLEVVLRLMGNPVPVATIVLVALLVVSGPPAPPLRHVVRHGVEPKR